MIEVKPQIIPDGLLEALDRWTGEYTKAIDLLSCIWIGMESCVGVFGDSSNGTYEWFSWDGKTLKTSNDGYGCHAIALRDVFEETK